MSLITFLNDLAPFYDVSEQNRNRVLKKLKSVKYYPIYENVFPHL